LFLLRSAKRTCLRENPWRSFKQASFHKTPRRCDEATYRPRLTSVLSPTLVLLGLIPICTFTLGIWQVQRLKWKVNLIDELQEKLQQQPLTLPKLINVSALSDFTFRKVLVKGRWDHAHTVLLGPRVRDGTKGFHVITPLVRSDGSTILVDRGFVSDDFGSVSTWRAPNQSSEEVEVLGMLRTAEKRNRFTPSNEPEKDQWYWVDVEALAINAGGEAAGVQPVYIEAIFEGHAGDVHLRMSRGIPIGRATTVELRNQHATYALTWFSLSAFTTFMFIRLLRRRARSPSVRMPR